MTKATARKLERRLRELSVYKPYVTEADGRVSIDSYPLTATITTGEVDPENGPVQIVRITDCSVSRDGGDPLLASHRVFIGQDTLFRAAELLRGFHEPAYARARAQDAEFKKRRGV